MQLEVGDRVRFNTSLPDHTVHVGWDAVEQSAEHLPGGYNSAPVESTWSEHYGGLPALVDAVDTLNAQVRVRGKDRRGNDFTVWLEPEHLTVVRKGLDLSDLEGGGQDG
jgi:hypothetical protein